jgi:hypothetical protein
LWAPPTRRTVGEMLGMRTRMRLELWLGCAAGILGLLTLVWRDWIEAVFGVDPDHGTGSLEWVVVVVLLALAVLLGTLARRDWRRLAAEGAAAGPGPS